jgi:GGDEF domain-containing protein
METLRDELIEIIQGLEHTYRHSISYGIVEIGPDNCRPAGELLQAADERMYAYKRARKKPPGIK